MFPADTEHYRTYVVEPRLAEGRATASLRRSRNRARTSTSPLRTGAAHALLWLAARLNTEPGGSDLRRAA